MRTSEKLKVDGWIEMTDGFLTIYKGKYRLEFRENVLIENSKNYLDISDNFDKNRELCNFIRIDNLTYEEIKQIENILIK